MSDYTVIPLSEVMPGDIAVGNGREFPVEFRGGQNQVRLGEWYVSATFASDTLGFEFRRPVPREPRTTLEVVIADNHGSRIDLPSEWQDGTRVRITEVLEP